MYALRETKGKQAFGLGYIWGLFYNLALLYGVFWATVPGTIGMLAVIAILPAFNAWLFSKVSSKNRIVGMAIWPALWVGWEYLRTLTELNFPWGDLGYTQVYYLPLIQPAELFGVYGVSLMVYTVNVILYAAVFLTRPRRRLKIGLIMSAVALPLLFYLYGLFRLPAEESPGGYRVAIAQGNIGPDVKWEKEGVEFSYSTYLELTKQAADSGAQLVIWPETAMPFYLLHDADKLFSLRRLLSFLKVDLLTGVPQYEKAGENEYIYFNSAALLSPSIDTVQLYSKIKLVPVSERIPFSGRFKKLKDIHLGQADFSSGREMVVFQNRDYEFATVICFESAFPGYCAEFCRRGANFLIVITNDMWFGPSSLPYQHAQMSVFRAVENRVPVLRCANTGVSMIIDSYGRIQAETGTFEKELICGTIAPVKSTSFYNRHGDWLPGLCLLFSGTMLGIAILRKDGYNE